MKKSRFLTWLFKVLHLKTAAQQQADDVVADPIVTGRGRGAADHGGDAWNIALSATARDEYERRQTVGARHDQAEQPERCA